MTDHLRVKSVVNIYNLKRDSDLEIEDSFAAAVTVAVIELEDLDYEVVDINVTSLLSEGTLVKTADIMYTLTDEQAGCELDDECEDEFEDEDDEPVKEKPTKIVVVPAVGKLPRKVNEAVFSFVHDMAGKYTPEETAEFFAGKLSVWTIKKILTVDTFDSYYVE